MATSHVKYSLFFFFRINMLDCKKPVKRSKSSWNEANIKSPLNMCREGKLIHASTKAYGMSEATLRNRFKVQEEGKTLVGPGRKIAIGEQKEKQLADCIRTIYNVSFSPSFHKIKEIVQEYVESNKLRTPFKNNGPGKKWVKSFMKRNRMSLKKANIISSARKSATSNPFIVFGFYDTLEIVMSEKQFLSS